MVYRGMMSIIRVQNSSARIDITARAECAPSKQVTSPFTYHRCKKFAVTCKVILSVKSWVYVHNLL